MAEIDDHLKKVSSPQKEELERIRKIVKSCVPNAEEVVSYGMPGFKYKDKYLITFAAFKNHMSLFPTSEPVEALKEKLTKFDITKGTIKFSVDNQIPEDIIRQLIRIRLKAINKKEAPSIRRLLT